MIKYSVVNESTLKAERSNLTKGEAAAFIRFAAGLTNARYAIVANGAC